MSSSNQLDTTTIILLVLGTIIVLPLLTMSFGGMMGYGGMMGQYGATGVWWPLAGMLLPLAFLLVLLGGGYLVLRQGTHSQNTQDPAMEELRTAYARGELADEEFEERRRKLQTHHED